MALAQSPSHPVLQVSYPEVWSCRWQEEETLAPPGEHPRTALLLGFQPCCSQAALVLSLKGLQGLYPQPRDPRRAGGNGRCPCCLRGGSCSALA